MSLINEALKRAKQETVRREAAQKGLPLPVLDHAPRPTPWALMAIAVLATALVASLAAVFMLARDRAPGVEPVETEPAAVSPVEPMAEAAATPDTDSTPVVESVAGSSEEESAPTPGLVATEIRPRQEPIPTTPSTEAMPEQPLDVIADPLAAGVSAAEVEPTGAPIDPEGTTYMHRAVLADGVTLELGGIAWSEFDPIALVNGKAVGQGERVSGYLVVQIDPQQVEMRGETGSIFIRLK